MTNRNFHKLLTQRFEDAKSDAIDKFNSHAFFRRFETMSEPQIHEYLAQRTFTSDFFISWYNRALCGLKSEAAKDLLRGILRDEIPRDHPTHFEDLYSDLISLGISRSKLLKLNPTSQTLFTIRMMKSLVDPEPPLSLQVKSPSLALSQTKRRSKVDPYSTDSNIDLKILVSLVIAGEILVSEEYGYIVRHFGFTEANSRFYYFHYEHDKSGSGSHWERFNSLISSSIVDEASLEVAIAAINTAVNVRLSFFLQFLEP